jgi:hypothetical protein
VISVLRIIQIFIDISSLSLIHTCVVFLLFGNRSHMILQ